MGYTTNFDGRFEFDKVLDALTLDLLNGLATTRRMKRNVDEIYGVEGEFYVEGSGDFGQAQEENIVEYNQHPKTQPGLWLGWIPTKDGKFLEWDQGEKFYNYIEWLQYLIKKILIPRGYILNGEVTWEGEESGDLGKIIVKDNVVSVKEGFVTYRTVVYD